MVSKEVQAAVDKVREMKDYIKADKEADKIRDEQLAAAKAAQAEADGKLNALQAKLDALPVNRELSQEDKDALQHAFDDAQEASTAATDAQANVTEVHDELKDAVPANADPVAPADEVPHVEAEPIPTDPDAPRPDPLPGTARGDGAPLMPNMAFDPDPTGKKGPGTDGQPNQPAAIETAGGFVVSGGGTTQRAPESVPDSPSSSVVVGEPAPAPIPAYQQDGVTPLTADEAAAAQAKYDAEKAAKDEQDKADAAAKEAQAKADADAKAKATADFPS